MMVKASSLSLIIILILAPTLSTFAEIKATDKSTNVIPGGTIYPALKHYRIPNPAGVNVPIQIASSGIHAISYIVGIADYKAGYKHGVSDAFLYLEQPRKGMSFHTQEFNQGFIDGWCSLNDKDTSSDSDAGTFYCADDATQYNNSTDPYPVGFVTGKHDAKTNVYDVTNACNNANYTAAQTYTCLNGYYDGTVSPYRVGYIQGVQGIELKGSHTPEFIKGYSKGIQGYWWNRGLVEGYNGLPMSSQNKNYTQKYKDGHAEYAAGYPGTKKCGIDLGKLPAYTNDNYKDFYLGLDQGGDAYWLVDGAHRFLEDGPPGQTAEFYAGWRWGYSLNMASDSDCGGVEVVK